MRPLSILVALGGGKKCDERHNYHGHNRFMHRTDGNPTWWSICFGADMFLIRIIWLVLPGGSRHSLHYLAHAPSAGSVQYGSCTTSHYGRLRSRWSRWSVWSLCLTCEYVTPHHKDNNSAIYFRHLMNIMSERRRREHMFSNDTGSAHHPLMSSTYLVKRSPCPISWYLVLVIS